MSSDGTDALRVALLTWEFPLISETFIVTLAADLAAAGVDLSILSLTPLPGRGDADAMRGDAVLADLQARILRAAHMPYPPWRESLAAWRTPRRAATLGALSSVAMALPARRTAGARLFAATGPLDVIHCQFATLGLAVMRQRRLGLARDGALVVHLRGYDITTFVQERGEGVYRELFAAADLLIANCRHFRDRAIALGADPDAVEVIGSPIDGDFFVPPKRRVAFVDRPARLVCVGRLVEKKGFGDAIDAVARLRAQGLAVQLDILGEGPLRSDLEARIARHDLGETVRLQGSASRTQVRDALHAADIALAPSVTARSGDADAPVNTLKEAMATGLPVIATRHGGIPELVVPGENGALVPERDAEALAVAIAAMMEAPGDWGRMGAAGRMKTLAKFERGAVARRTLAAYARAMARQSSRATR